MELLSQKLHTFNFDCQCQIFLFRSFPRLQSSVNGWNLWSLLELHVIRVQMAMCVLVLFWFHFAFVVVATGPRSLQCWTSARYWKFLTSCVSRHCLQSIANLLICFCFFLCFSWTQLNTYLCDLELSYFFFWELSVYVFCSFFFHWIVGHFLTDLQKSLTHHESRLLVHLQSGLQTLFLDWSFGEIFPHKYFILWPKEMTQEVEGFNSKREDLSSGLAPESETCLV